MSDTNEDNVIVRRPDRATGGLTEEERRQLQIHTQEWIAISLQTGRTDPEKVRVVIENLYAAAGLEKPRVVVVASPRMMAICGAILSTWWELPEPERLQKAQQFEQRYLELKAKKDPDCEQITAYELTCEVIHLATRGYGPEPVQEEPAAAGFPG